MASAEYYLGTEGAQRYHQSQQNLHAPPQQQPPGQQYPQGQFPAAQYNRPAQPYPAYAPQQQPPQYAQGYFAQQQQQQQQQLASPYPVVSPPYPTTPPLPHQQQQQYPYQHQHHQQPHHPNTYLSAPLQPVRSHSQPARVHFADNDSDSTDLGSASDSATPPRQDRYKRQQSHAGSDSAYPSHGHDRHHRHHQHQHQDDQPDHDHNGRRHRRRHRSSTSDRKPSRSTRNRDTFLGASAGGLIGDAIFPGLGTAAGLLVGGLGGRKYTERTRSDGDDSGGGGGGGSEGEKRRRRRRRRRRRPGDEGWDEESGTFKTGTAVR